MDQELKQYLDEMQAGMTGAINAAEERMRQHMAGVVDAAEERMKDFVREAIHDSETRIVGNLMKVAAAHETRMTALESSDGAVIQRLAQLEARILDLERRLPLQ